MRGFITPDGRKVLFVNKTDSDRPVKLSSELVGALSFTADEGTVDESPRTATVDGDELEMALFAVTVLKLK